MTDKEEELDTVSENNEHSTKTQDNAAVIDDGHEIDSACTDTASLSENEVASQAATKDKTKIDILLKATGNAPIMKKKKWAVGQDYAICKISDFIKKYLKLDPNEKLFLYINQTFSPPPDQTIKNLYDCYGTDGKLIIHYCKSQAWG